MKYKPLRYRIIEITRNSTLYALRYTLGGHRPSQTNPLLLSYVVVSILTQLVFHDHLKYIYRKSHI